MSEEEKSRLKPFAYPGHLRGFLHDLLVPKNAALPCVRDFRKDYDGSLTEVLQVEAEGLAIGEEWGDEGPILIIDLGFGELLWLSGQWLYDQSIVDRPIWERLESSPAGCWPRRFSLERAPRSGLVFGVWGTGDATESPIAWIKNSDLYYFGDSRILKGGIRTVEHDLKNEFQRLARHLDLTQRRGHGDQP